MAIGMIFEGAGVTRDQYNIVHDLVSPDNKKPAGMLSHAGGLGENGVVVIEVWESQEAATKFFQEKLGAALAAAKIDVMPRFFEVFNVME